MRAGDHDGYVLCNGLTMSQVPGPEISAHLGARSICIYISNLTPFRYLTLSLSLSLSPLLRTFFPSYPSLPASHSRVWSPLDVASRVWARRAHM